MNASFRNHPYPNHKLKMKCSESMLIAYSLFFSWFSLYHIIRANVSLYVFAPDIHLDILASCVIQIHPISCGMPGMLPICIYGNRLGSPWKIHYKDVRTRGQLIAEETHILGLIYPLLLDFVSIIISSICYSFAVWPRIYVWILQVFKCWRIMLPKVSLKHCGPVTSYGYAELCQHWLR